MGWQSKTLAEVTELITDGSHNPPPAQEQGIPMLSARNISQAGIDLYTGYRLVSEKDFLEETRRADPQPGDVLLTIVGTIGRTSLVCERHLPFCLQRSVALLRPKADLYSGYLDYWIQTPRVQKFLALNARGTAQKGVYLKSLKTMPVDYPDIAAQKEICAQVDYELSKLNACVRQLEAVQVKLKQARASILKAAVQGRLVETEAELARQSGSYYEDAEELFERVAVEAATESPEGHNRNGSLASINLDREAELPEPPVGWAWVRIDAVGAVQLGRQRTPKDHTGPHMCPYMRVANVFEDRIDLTDVKEMNFTPKEQEVFRLEHGDILLNEGQSPHLVGRPAMWRSEVKNACFQNTLVRFRATEAVLPKYALIVFRAQLHARRYMKIAKITTNIAHLGAQRFAAVEFPLAPLAEQHRIVAEVDRRFSVLDKVEATVNASLRRCGQLRQAVLKRALRV